MANIVNVQSPLLRVKSTINSKSFLAKKRKLPAELKILEFNSTKRSGDKVSVLNKELYKAYCKVEPSDSRKCMTLWELRRQMKKCIYGEDQSLATYDEAHKAIEFVCSKMSSSEELIVDNLKSVFEKIKNKYGEFIECVRLGFMSRTGYEVWLVQHYDEGPNKSLWFRQVFKLV